MSENRSPFEDPGTRGQPVDEQRARDLESDRERARDRDWRRDRRGGAWGGGNWIWGALLILLGILFLLDNIGLDAPFLENWWALFILIPAFGSFKSALNESQRRGRFTGSAVGSLVGGLVLTMVAFTFLLGLTWEIMLPVLLILGGLSILITTIAVNR